MPRAAVIGTTVGFTDYYNSVFLETSDNRAIVISRQTFDYMYHKLDPFTAALKEDCMEYASNDPMIDLSEHPWWYVEAVQDGTIYDMCGEVMFRVREDGTAIEVDSNSVILRNFQGDLRYMEWDDFTKYYDVPGSEFID